MILACNHIEKKFNDEALFSDVSFHINEHECTALVGVNGAGKTTLLRIIVGELPADNGDVILAKDTSVGYLPQQQGYHSDKSIYDELWEVKKDIVALEREIRMMEETMQTASGEELNPLLERYHRMQTEFEAKDGYACKSQIMGIINGLGFVGNDIDKSINTLSGGQKTRVALGKLLLLEPDLLILDEPTNHLDSAMAEWLENKLKNYRGALVMITHDRYFLDSVVTRIVELEQGKLYSYADSYLGYLALKSERKEMEAATERKRQSLLKTEIQWMMRGARARSTKQKAHIARYEALRDVTPPKIDENVQMTSVASRLGRTTIELNGICKSYDDRTLIRDFSYIFLKNDRIGIIGPNGCGKSTLMKLINGIETPDSGSIDIGQTVKIGYFSQENEYLDPSLKLIEYVREGAEVIHTPTGTISASQMLERFLFPSNMHYALIEKLSGGEKRRLYLLRILMEAPNVLFLDEPTNDLDIETLTILEDYLDHFAGIVVTVSHDRYFLDRVVRRIFAFEENGTITQYEGGYSDYLKKSGDKLSEMSTISDKKESSRNPDSTSKDTWKKNAPKKLKFSYKEQRDYETIEEDIQKLEEKITSLGKEMEESASNYSRLTELNEEKENAEMALLEKMERWEYLEDLAAQIENQ